MITLMSLINTHSFLGESLGPGLLLSLPLFFVVGSLAKGDFSFFFLEVLSGRPGRRSAFELRRLDRPGARREIEHLRSFIFVYGRAHRESLSYRNRRLALRWL